MAILGEDINIESLTVSANHVALVSDYLLNEELMNNDAVVTEIYRYLGRLAAEIFNKNLYVAAFGEYFVGQGDLWQEEFNVMLEGDSAGLVGSYDGICTVIVDDEVVIEASDGKKTAILPALKFNTNSVYLTDLGLSAAQLFPKVAVPLTGQVSALYWCGLTAADFYGSDS